jgi:hypothetical protein
MSSSLEKLKKLTESLCVRDTSRIQELELYQTFFETIPVQMFVWTVDEDLNVLVKNRASMKEECAKTVLTNGTVKDAFSCPKMNETNIQHHQNALKGKQQLYLCKENDSTFLTTLVPEVKGGSVLVHGCSWEVTGLVNITCALSKVASSNGKDVIDAIKPLEEAINSTPIIELVAALEGKND